jgi:hypothetical protein
MMRYSMSQNVGHMAHAERGAHGARRTWGTWRTQNVGPMANAERGAHEARVRAGRGRRAATRRRDYNRHGTTTTPFVAPSEPNGTVIRQCQPRHRHASMTCHQRACESTRDQAIEHQKERRAALELNCGIAALTEAWTRIPHTGR